MRSVPISLDRISRQIIVFSLLALISAAGAHAAAPSPPSQTPLSREEADHLLGVLKDPEQRARFITTLEEYTRAAPAAATGAARATPPSPAVAPGKAAASGSVMARTVRYVAQSATAVVTHLGHGFRALTDWSALTAWLDAAGSQPNTRTDVLQVSMRIALIGALALAVEILLRRISARHPPSQTRPAASAATFADRAKRAFRPFLWTLAIVAIVGLLGNAAIFVALGDFPTGSSLAFGVLNAYLGVRLFMGLITALFAPRTPADRIILVGDAAAAHATGFARLLSATIAFGFVCSELVADLGASIEVHESVQKLVALVIHVLLIVMVVRSRRIVADWIRHRFGPKNGLRAIGEAFATAWPFIAVTAIVSWWLVWAMDIPDGYQRILRFVLTTTAVLIIGQFLASFLVGTIDRRLSPLAGGQPAGLSGRLMGYRRTIRNTTQIALFALTSLVLLQTWGVDVLRWFDAGHVGNRVGLLTLKLLLLAVIGIVCWEVADAAVEARVARLMADSALARATRLRTLQPIVRIALVILLSLVVVLTALTEIGINVGPLLAGASIFGVALGFGSQKLVQDFITGIFLLVEDAMDVGDYVTLAGVSGTVEHLSIRTIRLRAGDGSVHLIPFSAVTSVNNTNRGIGNAAVSVTVDAAEDTDRIGALLQAIALEMRAEPAFAASMQSDLQLWGVDKLDGSGVTVAGQIVCSDTGRWSVQREFNRRLKMRFEQEHIQLGVPHQAMRIERLGHTPPVDFGAPPRASTT